MAGLSPKETCPSCGLPFCALPWEVCARDMIAADRAELVSLRKQLAGMNVGPNRGVLLNQHATLGSEIVRLLESIPELGTTSSASGRVSL